MRKLPKGAAITAGILFILSAVIALASNLITYSRIPHVPTITYITAIVPCVTGVLLAVALLRGKADVLAGIFCLLNIPMPLFGIISNISAIGMYLARNWVPYTVNSVLAIVMQLARIAAFAMMAVQCFKKAPRKNSLCTVLALVAGIVSVLYNVWNTLVPTMMYGGYAGIGRMLTHNLPALIGSLIGAVIGAVPLILAGVAFSKVKTGEAAPTDLYAQQMAQFQAAQYQQPQYQAQYQAPQYQQPQYQAPQYQQPQYQAPQYQQPQYQQPQYQAPQYQQPQYQQPMYQAPQYQQPQYQQPMYQAPQYQQPQYQQPMYQAPQAPLPQEQPQYEAPQAPSQEQ